VQLSIQEGQNRSGYVTWVWFGKLGSRVDRGGGAERRVGLLYHANVRRCDIELYRYSLG
jgi:hypothetical protein